MAPLLQIDADEPTELFEVAVRKRGRVLSNIHDEPQLFTANEQIGIERAVHGVTMLHVLRRLRKALVKLAHAHSDTLTSIESHGFGPGAKGLYNLQSPSDCALGKTT